MSKFCPISGKKPQSGHNVSHSRRHTKRRFLPNLHTHSVWIDSQKRSIKMRLTAYAIRLIDKLGFEQAIAKSQLKLKR
jgi:large subunit ribosomal protein L28